MSHSLELVDTHAHISYMVKDDPDTYLTTREINEGIEIVKQAAQHHVAYMIDVGTSVSESKNCIEFSGQVKNVYASIAIHPENASQTTLEEVEQIRRWAKQAAQLKIVAIGECGIDKHYQGYNLQKQIDLFKSHIEICLENNLGLIIHSRDAADETLHVVQEYYKQGLRGIMHCFSYDRAIAKDATNMHLRLGIGGTVTYPKNNELRAVVQAFDLKHIVLETDAPFLPIQSRRGQKNHPQYIYDIAQYIAELKQTSIETVGEITTNNVKELFPAIT